MTKHQPFDKQSRRAGSFEGNEHQGLVILIEHGISQETLENPCLEGYSLIGGFQGKATKKGLKLDTQIRA